MHRVQGKSGELGDNVVRHIASFDDVTGHHPCPVILPFIFVIVVAAAFYVEMFFCRFVHG